MKPERLQSRMNYMVPADVEIRFNGIKLDGYLVHDEIIHGGLDTPSRALKGKTVGTCMLNVIAADPGWARSQVPVVQWQEWLATWRFGSFGIALSVADARQDLMVTASLRVEDVQHGGTIQVHTRESIPSNIAPGSKDAVELVHRIVHVLIAHELDEQITVETRHIFDPHSRNTRR